MATLAPSREAARPEAVNDRRRISRPILLGWGHGMAG